MILPSKGAFEPCMTWEEKCKTSNTKINRMIIYQDQMTKFKFSTKTKFPKTLNRQKSSLKLHKLTQIIPVEDLQNLHIHPDHEETFMMLCTQFWDVFFQDLINQKMISRIILKKTLECHSQRSIFSSASTLKSITWTVCPAVMKSQIGLQNPRNIFNASIESQRAMAQWRCSSPTL